MVLDGEIVAFDAKGVPSFNALQNRAQLKTEKEIAEGARQTPIAYVCFDLLHFAGLNLRGSPYIDRRRYLTQCLLPSDHVQLVHVSDDAEKLYAAAIDRGFEGIVAKRKDSTYQPGRRSSAWQKIKAVQSAEFVVGGYTKGKGAREPLGALLLGYWDDKKFRYVGHVGSGLDEETFQDLRERVAKLTRKTSPFAEKVDLHRPTTWVEPKLVVEVNFASFTPDGNLRAPVFLRLRDDKDAARSTQRPGADRQGRRQAADSGSARSPMTARPRATRAAVRERRSADPPDRAPSTDDIESVLQQLEAKPNRLDLNVGGAKVRLTNLDREYWPGDKRTKPVTKRDLLRYLAERLALHAAAPAGPPAHDDPHARGHQRRALLPETLEPGEDLTTSTRITVFSEHKDERHDLSRRQQPALAPLARPGRHARVSRLAFALHAGRGHARPDR